MLWDGCRAFAEFFSPFFNTDENILCQFDPAFPASLCALKLFKPNKSYWEFINGSAQGLSALVSSSWLLDANWELHVIGSHVKLLEVISCGWLVADWYLPGWSRCRCNLVSQCVGASDLWPPCLSVELPFDCFIPSRALESMLMSKVLIYQSIRG